MLQCLGTILKSGQIKINAIKNSFCVLGHTKDLKRKSILTYAQHLCTEKLHIITKTICIKFCNSEFLALMKIMLARHFTP